MKAAGAPDLDRAFVRLAGQGDLGALLDLAKLSGSGMTNLPADAATRGVSGFTGLAIHFAKSNRFAACSVAGSTDGNPGVTFAPLRVKSPWIITCVSRGCLRSRTTIVVTAAGSFLFNVSRAFCSS